MTARLLLTLGLVAWAASPARSNLTIAIDYAGDPQYEGYFTAAATTWENLLVGYRDGYTNTVTISASVGAIDNAGGILAQAGPTLVGLVTAANSPNNTNDVYALEGVMDFDVADIGNLVSGGLFDDVVRHEMAHVLGFGTLWGYQSLNFPNVTFNDVYDSVNGEFTGAAATASWQSEFGQTGAPDVEQGGGPGTADGHWNEVDSGAGPTGITDALGRDLSNEIMTGWLNGETFISQMTIDSFRDIGFLGSVVAVPEAGSALAFGLAGVWLGASGRRRPA